MQTDMIGVYPQLGNPHMAHAWSGLMSYALHRMPLIGELAPGQWAAAAFGGHGLNTTAMAGRLLARALADGDDEWRRFQVFGTPWVGGLVGRAGVQLSYWRMQIRDRFDEIRAGTRSAAGAERRAGARAAKPRNPARASRRGGRGR
jgi:gamma-glutamylputrescine oxidase